MIYIDDFGKGSDLDLSLDLLLRHILGDLLWASGDSSDQAVAELFAVYSVFVGGQYDRLLSCEFAAVENDDLSLLEHQIFGVCHWFINFLFLINLIVINYSH